MGAAPNRAAAKGVTEAESRRGRRRLKEKKCPVPSRHDSRAPPPAAASQSIFATAQKPPAGSHLLSYSCFFAGGRVSEPLAWSVPSARRGAPSGLRSAPASVTPGPARRAPDAREAPGQVEAEKGRAYLRDAHTGTHACTLRPPPLTPPRGQLRIPPGLWGEGVCTTTERRRNASFLPAPPPSVSPRSWGAPRPRLQVAGGREEGGGQCPAPGPPQRPPRSLRVQGVRAQGVGSPLPPPLTSRRPSPQVPEAGATGAPADGRGAGFPRRGGAAAGGGGQGRALCRPPALPPLQRPPSPPSGGGRPGKAPARLGVPAPLAPTLHPCRRAASALTPAASSKTRTRKFF